MDRGGRELPISADYAVRSVELPLSERVDVIDDAQGLRAIVQPANAPSTPAPPGAV